MPPLTRQPISLSARPNAPLVLAHALSYAALLSLPLSVHSIRAGQNRPGLQPEDLVLLRLVDRVCGGFGQADGGLAEGRLRWDGEPRNGWDEDGAKWEVQPRAGRTNVGGLVLAVLPLLLVPPRPERLVQDVDGDDENDEDDGASSASRASSPAFARSGTPPPSPPLSASSSACLDLPRRPSSSTVTIAGGSTTLASGAPSPTFLSLVLLPFLAKHFDAHPTLTTHRPGFTPAGGAAVSLSVPPLSPADLPLRPFTLTDAGDLVQIEAHVFCSGRKTPSHVLSRLSSALVATLRASPAVPAHIDIVVVHRREALDGPGVAGPTTAQAQRAEVGVCVVARTTTGCALAVEESGEGGRFAPEEVGERAGRRLVEELRGGGCVDSTMQVRVARASPPLRSPSRRER